MPLIIYGLHTTTIPAFAERVRVSIDPLEQGQLCKLYAAAAPGVVLVGLIVGTIQTVLGDGVAMDHGLSLDFGSDPPPVVPGASLCAEFTNTTCQSIAVRGFGFVVGPAPLRHSPFRAV
jgi:hypothetical protein